MIVVIFLINTYYNIKMVRVSSEQGCLFKIWRFLLTLWEIVMLFFASLLKTNPRDVKKEDAIPFRTSSYRPGGSGGGGGGGPPGGNIKGLPRGGTSKFPMGGGG
jgi:hypothetical protein